jgi:hypothetical protein
VGRRVRQPLDGIAPSMERGCFMSLCEKSLVSRPVMREAEIVRQLQLLRNDDANRAPVRGGRKVPLIRVAKMAGLHRATLYRAIMQGRISDKSRVALSPALIMHMDGGLLSRQPGPPPRPQDKLVRAVDWNEWSFCRTCGGTSFSPVILHNAAWYFCDGCLPPSQYPALGACAAD